MLLVEIAKRLDVYSPNTILQLTGPKHCYAIFKKSHSFASEVKYDFWMPGKSVSLSFIFNRFSVGSDDNVSRPQNEIFVAIKMS